jgi:hypothetical protein
LSLDSDDKCLANSGPRNFDFLAGLSSSPLSSFMSNNNDKNENDLNLFSNKIWNSGFLDTPQEDLEQAFSKLYTKQKEADLPQDKASQDFDQSVSKARQFNTFFNVLGPFCQFILSLQPFFL